MRYVTCYDSFLGGLTDVTIHEDEEIAIKFYRKEANYYFHGLNLPKKVEAPAACGFPHRVFRLMSIRKFKKLYPEYKGGFKCHPKK